MTEYICPNCKSPINDDEALLCHFCGESLQRSNKGLLGNMKYGQQRIFWFFVIILVLLGFILLYLR